jgi:hypothetical protein
MATGHVGLARGEIQRRDILMALQYAEAWRYKICTRLPIRFNAPGVGRLSVPTRMPFSGALGEGRLLLTCAHTQSKTISSLRQRAGRA